MNSMEKLLEAMDECGEAAVFYKGKKVLMANKRFAEMFEIDLEKCKGLPIVDILHEGSIEMISDFIRRRSVGDRDVPAAYTADFRSASTPKLPIQLTVIRTSETDGAVFVVLQRA
jgi:hypothetical protein